MIGYTPQTPKSKEGPKYTVRASLGSASCTRERSLEDFEALEKHLTNNKPICSKLPAINKSVFGNVKDAPVALVEPLGTFLQQNVFRPENVQDAYILNWLGLESGQIQSVSCKSTVNLGSTPGTVLIQSQHDPASGLSMQLISKESSKLISIFSSANSVLSLHKTNDSGVFEEIAAANLSPHAVCFDWDSASSAVLVGHSTGTVALYMVSSDKKTINQVWSATAPVKIIKSVGLMAESPAVFVSAEQKLFTLSRESGQLLSGTCDDLHQKQSSAYRLEQRS